jgi:hypothetical protein
VFIDQALPPSDARRLLLARPGLPSQTVNPPRWASAEEVERAFTLAWRSGCKGATVLRDGCRGQQVLLFGRIPAFAVGDSIARAHAEYAGDCRLCSV